MSAPAFAATAALDYARGARFILRELAKELDGTPAHHNALMLLAAADDLIEELER